jgi:hypothetical protein
MTPVAERQRLCGECKKVVHNITGLSREQIFELLQSDPGNICVNFTDIRVAKDTETKFPKQKPHTARRIRYMATTAAILMLVQQAHNAPFVPNPAIPQTLAPDQNSGPKLLSNNTIVSGIVLDRNNNQMRNELDVVISCEGAEIMRVKTRGGMFSCDLKGHADAGDSITISVLPGPQASSNVADAPKETPVSEVSEATGNIVAPVVTVSPITWSPGNEWMCDKWSGGSKNVLLADAQNVEIFVDYSTFFFLSQPYQMGGVPPMVGRVITWPWIPFDPGYGTVAASPSQPRAQDESCTDHHSR